MEESDCMTDLAECVLLLLRQTGLKELLSTAWDNSKAKNLRALRDLKHGKTGCWHHRLHFHSTLLLCPWAKLLTWSDSSTVLQLKDHLKYGLIRGMMAYWYYYKLQALNLNLGVFVCHFSLSILLLGRQTLEKRKLRSLGLFSLLWPWHWIARRKEIQKRRLKHFE